MGDFKKEKKKHEKHLGKRKKKKQEKNVPVKQHKMTIDIIAMQREEKNLNVLRWESSMETNLINIRCCTCQHLLSFSQNLSGHCQSLPLYTHEASKQLSLCKILSNTLLLSIFDNSALNCRIHGIIIPWTPVSHFS